MIADSVIKIKGLDFSFGGPNILENIELDIQRNEFIGMVGPNGSGKTTLLKMLADVIEIDNGERKTGHNVSTAYYAQHLLEQLDPSSTVIGELRKTSPEKPEGYLRNVLGGFLFPGDDVYKPVSVLSGGEKARVALAKLLIQPTNLLLMDEPFGALDPITRAELQEEFKHIQSELNLTVIMVTHDMTEALLMAHRIAVMKDGEILQIGSPRELINQPRHDYVKEIVEMPKRRADRLEKLIHSS